MDDAITLSEASVQEVREIKKMLGKYEEEAVQKINYSKSRIFLFNTNDRRSRRIANILGCQIGNLPSPYLGIPLFSGKMKKDLWNPIIEKITRKLAG